MENTFQGKTVSQHAVRMLSIYVRRAALQPGVPLGS